MESGFLLKKRRSGKWFFIYLFIYYGHISGKLNVKEAIV